MTTAILIVPTIVAVILGEVVSVLTGRWASASEAKPVLPVVHLAVTQVDSKGDRIQVPEGSLNKNCGRSLRCSQPPNSSPRG